MNGGSADGPSGRGVAGNSGNLRGVLQCRDELRQCGDRRNIYIYERLRCGEANGRDTPDFKPMQTHSSVIENFIREGKGGKGTYLRATDDVLLSKIPDLYRPYGHGTWVSNAAGQTAELAVRL